MSSRNRCCNKRSTFCNVCGKYETESFRWSINDSIKTVCLKCYGTSMKNLEKPWVPTSICNTCRVNLIKCCTHVHMLYSNQLFGVNLKIMMQNATSAYVKRVVAVNNI